jgi:hypothetical protein
MRKRIYQCLPNVSTGMVDVVITDEDGRMIYKSSYDNAEKAQVYFQEIREELAMNKSLEVVQINNSHFEYVRHEEN